MMNTDREDTAILTQQAEQILRKRILGISPVMQLLIIPERGDCFRIDLIHHANGSWSIEQLAWRRTDDLRRMNDPLEKVKLLGDYQPSLDRESTVLTKAKGLKLQKAIAGIMENADQHTNPNPSKREEDIQYTLWMEVDTREARVRWYDFPDHWTMIPDLMEALDKEMN